MNYSSWEEWFPNLRHIHATTSSAPLRMDYRRKTVGSLLATGNGFTQIEWRWDYRPSSLTGPSASTDWIPSIHRLAHRHTGHSVQKPSQHQIWLSSCYILRVFQHRIRITFQRLFYKNNKNTITLFMLVYSHKFSLFFGKICRRNTFTFL